MPEEIYSRLMPLPGKVGGFVVKKDDVYTIVVNSNNCDSARMRYYEDEVRHIQRDDIDSEETADQIEARSHGNG